MRLAALIRITVDDGDLEARIGGAEIVAHGLCVEPPGDLFRRRNLEGVASDRPDRGP